jgi:hypothetical protein
MKVGQLVASTIIYLTQKKFSKKINTKKVAGETARC